MAGPATSAGSPSSTATACSTAAAGFGSTRSARCWSRGCTRYPGSGSCCTGPGQGWAGRCGSTPPPSTSPSTSASARSPPPAARPSCWPHARTWRRGGWIQPGRYGNYGCCPACRTSGWARTSGCTTPSPIPAPSRLLADNLRRRRNELGRGWSGLAHPGRTARKARRALPAWREVLTERPAPHTSLNRPVGTGRRLAIIRSGLDVTKQIAHAHSATVNDVVLAAVAGGLRQLLASRGEDVQHLVQRAMVTISLHDEQPGQAHGNKPGWMMVPLPLGEPDPARRLELITAQTAARKHKDRPQAGTGI